MTRDRERERDRDEDGDAHVCVYTQTYMTNKANPPSNQPTFSPNIQTSKPPKHKHTVVKITHQASKYASV